MKQNLAYLGECYVQLELAKREFSVNNVSRMGFDFIGENGVKIEVKSASPSTSAPKKKGSRVYDYRYKLWQFRCTTEKQKSAADFYICVIFEEISAPPIGYFVLPRSRCNALGKSGIINIHESDLRGEFKKKNKEDKHQFLNKWDLILKHPMDNIIH